MKVLLSDINEYWQIVTFSIKVSFASSQKYFIVRLLNLIGIFIPFLLIFYSRMIINLLVDGYYLDNGYKNIVVTLIMLSIIILGLDITNPFNSYAAPLITAKILEILHENPHVSFHEIHHSLIQNAKEVSAETWFDSTEWVYNCPVVLLINPIDAVPVSILQLLKGIFTENSYHCHAAAYIQREEPDVEMIPEGISLPQYIRWFCHFFQCDIAFFALSGNLISQEVRSCFDLIITDEQGCFSIKTCGEDGEILANPTDIKDLYLQIVQILQ